jgi:hypothetical protein
MNNIIDTIITELIHFIAIINFPAFWFDSISLCKFTNSYTPSSSQLNLTILSTGIFISPFAICGITSPLKLFIKSVLKSSDLDLKLVHLLP